MGTVSKEFGSIREAVAAWVGKLPMGTKFSIMELERNVKRLYPEYVNTRGHTIDRRLRDCREDQYGYNWYPICIDENKALYQKVTIKEGRKYQAEKEAKRLARKRGRKAA